MQWKAIHFKGEKGKKNKSEWYGIRSTIYPGKVNELILFEKCLLVLVKNVPFRRLRNHFFKKF